MPSTTQPTRVRYLVVAVTALAAMWMYIDRVCFSTLAPEIRVDLGIEEDDMAFVLGAFFFTYALFQIPIGSLADRYGPRVVLTVAIVAWSLCTAATALAAGAAALLAVRLGLGVCEAGAYPAAAGLVRRWSSARERGLLSSIVAFGGRIGGALAPVLTALAAVRLFGDPESGQRGWRGVFFLYGMLGLLAAVAFWWLARDTPARHPWANAAEAARVPPAGPAPATAVPWSRRFLALAGSGNMWLYGVTQFFVNIGWVFLITKLPGYLNERFGVGTEQIGLMQTVTLVASCVGTACGGVFADVMYRALGPRWGRSAPVAIVMLLCAATYGVATQMPTAWGVVAALAVMAFLVDLGIPSIWAFAQDVGGRHVGVALGWGNMWGNFGAAVSPVALQVLQRKYGWDVAFAVCAVCFVAAAGCGLSLNALIPVTREVPELAAPTDRKADPT